MKTVDFFKKNYRELNGNIQNMVINQVKQLFFNTSFSALENSLFDSNIIVFYCIELNIIRFDQLSFSNFCKKYHECCP